MAFLFQDLLTLIGEITSDHEEKHESFQSKKKRRETKGFEKEKLRKLKTKRMK